MAAAPAAALGFESSNSGTGKKKTQRGDDDLGHVIRIKSAGNISSSFASCFTGVTANGAAAPFVVKHKKGSRQSRASQVYDPTLAKKILGRTHQPTTIPTLSERLKDSCDCDEMPFQQLFHNEDHVNEEAEAAAFMSPKDGVLDQYMFRNVPDVASMQLGQERHRREVCSSKLQEIERDLQEFAQAFSSKLLELKKSMGEFAQSMKELMHYDEGNYIEDRLWEEADTTSSSGGKVIDIVTSSQSPPHR